MKTPDILKLIEYKITGGSNMFNHNNDKEILKKYNLKGETRSIEYLDESSEFSKRSYDGDITINGEDVLRITLRFPDNNGYFRWTDIKYKPYFKEMAKKNQYNDTYAYDSIKYTEVYLLEEILNKIQDVMKTGKCSYDVSYPIEIDQEFLELAKKTAETNGISVENWLAECINDNQSQFIKKVKP